MRTRARFARIFTYIYRHGVRVARIFTYVSRHGARFARIRMSLFPLLVMEKWTSGVEKLNNCNIGCNFSLCLWWKSEDQMSKRWTAATSDVTFPSPCHGKVKIHKYLLSLKYIKHTCFTWKRNTIQISAHRIYFASSFVPYLWWKNAIER